MSRRTLRDKGHARRAPGRWQLEARHGEATTRCDQPRYTSRVPHRDFGTGRTSVRSSASNRRRGPERETSSRTTTATSSRVRFDVRKTFGAAPLVASVASKSEEVGAASVSRFLASESCTSRPFPLRGRIRSWHLTSPGTNGRPKTRAGASTGPSWQRGASSVAIARGRPGDVIGASIARGRGLPVPLESAW